MKKTIYFVTASIIIALLSCIFVEIIFQTVPAFYKLLPEDNEKTYLYIIGESSAYGYPYNIPYSKIIQYITGNKINNKDIETVMLAYPGDTLFDQYKKYVRYKFLHPFKKGIVLAYMGTNDWSNRGLEKRKEPLSGFYLISFLKNYFDRNHNFLDDYEQIIVSSKRFGDDIFVSTIAGNYGGFMPNDVSSLSNKNLKENLKQTDTLIAEKKYDSAFSKCKEMFAENHNKAQIWYKTGKIYESLGKTNEANEAYLNAVEYGWDARPARYQNTVIKFLAAKYQIPLADIFGKLLNSGDVIGYKFFDDKIHPSLILNILIAENFVNLISSKYQVDIINASPDSNAILKYCRLNDYDLFDAYKNVFGEIFAYSLIDGNVDAYNLPKLKECVEKMGKLNINESLKDKYINACNMLIAYLKGNLEEMHDILYKKKLIDKLDEINIFCYKFRWDGKLIIDKIHVENKAV